MSQPLELVPAAVLARLQVGKHVAGLSAHVHTAESNSSLPESSAGQERQGC